MSSQFSIRIRAAVIHAGFCIVVATCAALLVFGLWFPGPYRDMCGGLRLFFLLTAVDVVAGPVLTFVIVSAGKSKRHLSMDIAVVVLFQLAALGYGLHAVSLARPVVLAAENSLFRIVTARDVKEDELPEAPDGLRELSWHGARTVGVRASRNGDEMARAIDWAMRGYDAGTRPSYWQSYEKDKARVLRQATPLMAFLGKSGWQKSRVEAVARDAGLAPGDLKVMPVLARESGWYVLLDAKSADIKGFAQLEQDTK